MKKSIFGLLAAFVTVTALAQTAAHKEIDANPLLSASNHVAYPYDESNLPQLTKAPDGYEPFYMAHYGRHGSRWLTGYRTYSRPVRMLERADSAGQLTSLGKQVLSTLRLVRDRAYQRAGDLSDLGAEQHQAIARRMYRNFPEIFGGDAHIDARSTIVIRCILSMQNETSTLKALNPKLDIATDASLHDMHYMGWGYGEDTLANSLRKSLDGLTDAYRNKYTHPERFIGSLIISQDWAKGNIDSNSLMNDIFSVAGSLQNHHEFDGLYLLNLFTSEERYDLWKHNNIYWYTHWANAPQNGNRMPYIEKALLHNMIASADSVIACNGKGASLRFGHETCLLPLACLLELDSVNDACDNLDSLDQRWVNYKFYPMGCNIQMVFYRNSGGDVLLKVLFNEHEARLPFETKTFPYYKWNDIKRYYYEKSSKKINWN